METTRYPHISWETHEDVGEMWVMSRHPVDGHQFGLRYDNTTDFSKQEAHFVRVEVLEAMRQYVAEHPEGEDGDNA